MALSLLAFEPASPRTFKRRSHRNDSLNLTTNYTNIHEPLARRSQCVRYAHIELLNP